VIKLNLRSGYIIMWRSCTSLPMPDEDMNTNTCWQTWNFRLP